MSEDADVLQIDFIEDAPKDGHWYEIMFPNNDEACMAQLVRWDENFDMWQAFMIPGGNEDPNFILLYEDGRRWTDVKFS